MTELIWHGKYDREGRRSGPLRVPLPFQTVETVNESAQDRQQTLNLFARGRDTDWRNRLIWGDKKYVLPALLDQFAAKVDLIYIDPPFATGDDFSMPIAVDGSEFDHEPTLIEQKAYRDTWGVSKEERQRGITSLDRYLKWFNDTVTVLRDLLAESGSIYVHLDPHIGHYAKTVLDEVFGKENFQNEIVWCYNVGGKGKTRWAAKHDCIYFYSKGANWHFDGLAAGVNRETGTKSFGGRIGTDEEGRRYQDKLVKATGKLYRYYLDEPKIPEDWWSDINSIQSGATERTNYPTQKPEALLARIIAASSKPGDLVLDCFAGSGTTPCVAERLGRRWIAADLGRFAIHTTRKRLLAIAEVRPFVIENLGKYERQLWQKAEFGNSAEPRTRAYRAFILDAFKAGPIHGYNWLHGVKQGRYVHVGTVDAPVTVGDVKQIATEFRKAIGTGKDAPTSRAVDVLGWDFAFEVNEVARQEAARAGIDMRFWRIPREVLDKRAIDQGDIRFFELAALEVGVKRNALWVEVSLADFIIPLDDVPAEVREVITDWSQWIDYWAVDWDNKSDTFHNEWQTYRTRKEVRLQKSATHEYSEPGEYRVVVKVIDILGNDTTKTLTVEVS
jgi:DNA modification methylase